MKRIASFLGLVALVSGVEACDWLPIGFGDTVAHLQSKLDVQIRADLPEVARQATLPGLTPGASEAFARLTFPGRQICPSQRALADSFVTYHFAFDHLYRVEVVSGGRQQLLRLAQSTWGAALRSKRVPVDAQRPLYRWNLPTAFVTYRGTSKGKSWHESLDILGKGQQAHVLRLQQARQPGVGQ